MSTDLIECFFEANDIGAAKQRAVLLSGIGAAGYKLFAELVLPEKPTDKTYAVLAELMQTHLSPRPSEFVERFKFYKRLQVPNESVVQYMSELRRLAPQPQDCNFEATQNKMLRDIFVIGVTNEGIRRTLLAVKDLDLDKAIEIASALEVAPKNARDIKKAQHTSHTTALAVGVNQVMNKDKGKSTPRPNGIPQPKFGNKRQKVRCYRCGGIHRQEDCRYRNPRCFSCGKWDRYLTVRDNRTHLVNDTQQPSSMTDVTQSMRLPLEVIRQNRQSRWRWRMHINVF